jgi:hypothetical protein
MRSRSRSSDSAMGGQERLAMARTPMRGGCDGKGNDSKGGRDGKGKGSKGDYDGKGDGSNGDYDGSGKEGKHIGKGGKNNGKNYDTLLDVLNRVKSMAITVAELQEGLQQTENDILEIMFG